MLKRVLVCAAIPFCLAYGDFQYQSTSRMTGGSLLQMMRFVPGTGALKEPQVSTIAVKGNQMVHRGKHQAEIIDLDKRTITRIDFDKKTYAEITFEQMKQALQQMSAQMQDAQKQKPADASNVDVNFNIDVKDLGQNRNIAGYDTHGVMLTFAMNATDTQSAASGAMKVNSEMWVAKDVAGYSEMRDFYKRMAQELDWAPTGMGAMFNRPDLARAMAKMMAEGGKMEGTPVEQVMKFVVEGTGNPQASQGQPGQAQPPQQQAAPPRPSVSDALGGALGGKLGLGGFGRKKKQETPASADNSAQQANPDNQAANQTTTSGSLMEMTIDNTGFSTSGVDTSLFTVPAGFKKVEEDPLGGRSRGR